MPQEGQSEALADEDAVRAGFQSRVEWLSAALLLTLVLIFAIQGAVDFDRGTSPAQLPSVLFVSFVFPLKTIMFPLPSRQCVGKLVCLKNTQGLDGIATYFVRGHEIRGNTKNIKKS